MARFHERVSLARAWTNSTSALPSSPSWIAWPVPTAMTSTVGRSLRKDRQDGVQQPVLGTGRGGQDELLVGEACLAGSAAGVQRLARRHHHQDRHTCRSNRLPRNFLLISGSVVELYSIDHLTVHKCTRARVVQRLEERSTSSTSTIRPSSIRATRWAIRRAGRRCRSPAPG